MQGSTSSLLFHSTQRSLSIKFKLANWSGAGVLETKLPIKEGLTVNRLVLVKPEEPAKTDK